MGLDSVEILMSWEAAFGITIADEEAFELRNTRMAVDLIASKVGAVERSPVECLSLRAFNRLRVAFCEVGASRASVSPSAKVRHLIIGDSPGGTKRSLRQRMGIPKLPLAGGWTGVMFSPQTIGDLAGWIVCNHPKAIFKPGEGWSRSQVRQVVRAVVVAHIGVPLDYSDDADFVQELGVD